jgi:mannose-1-phosphate guanylyltransferase/mannose-1-phosphate guanylyltransferase/phosphomannomutase
MLPVGGRPALEYTVAWLRHHGIRTLLINLHHQPDAVIRHFGDGSACGVSIEYSIEERILGTAGGTRRRADFFDQPFVVVYGDVLTDFNLSALVERHTAQAGRVHLTMSLMRVPDPERCGVAELDGEGRVINFVEKPPAGRAPSNLASAGVLVLDPGILGYVPDGVFYDYGLDLIPALLRDGAPVYGWALPEAAYLIDFGTPENYRRAQVEWPTPRALQCLAERAP